MINNIVREERVYFADITLLVLDECHNCTKDHPYRVLMQMLAESSAPHKPQIVGLTASMGVGGHNVNDVEAAKRHMLKLCANLMADSISTVRRYLDNLREKVMPPVDDVQRAKRPPEEYDVFSRVIKEAMQSVQMGMRLDLEEIQTKQSVPLRKVGWEGECAYVP